MQQERELVIVSGAARGIGAAIARKFAGQGLAVGLIDIDVKECTETAQAIVSAGGEAASFAADVSSEKAVDEAVEFFADTLGPPSILVNNAGFARDTDLRNMKTDDWDAVHSVHLRGSFLLARRILPYMEAKGWGRIINISSISAQGHAGRANYCAAKAGMHGFIKALAVELGPLGITANAVAPGLIVTRMTDATASRRGLSLDDHLADAISRIPVRRAGRPEDIAHTVAFLASRDSGFINGQVIYVAGGPCD